MTRIIVTSGDPATGVVGIEQAPTTECPTCQERRFIGHSAWLRCPLCGIHDEDITTRNGELGRVPLSLPATVEVARECTVEHHRLFDGMPVRPDGSACDGFVVLGTATLEGVWEWEKVERTGASTATLAVINFGPLLRQDGCAWIARNIYDALAPGGLVAYLTDWQPLTP